MGRKSIKENKNIYQQTRESKNLSREQASELTVFISPSRLEKIENERSAIQPDEVLALANAYKRPFLCDNYCATECPLGAGQPELDESEELAQIVVKMVATLTKLNNDKDRIIEIAADGVVSDNERDDFDKILENLEKISSMADALKLWIKTVKANEEE